jgi:DNA polymerase-3 subunit delta
MSQLEKELARIRKGNYKRVYLVHGTEDYLIEQVKQVFVQTLLKDEEAADFNFGQYDMKETPVGVALQEAESFPFFGDERLLFIHQPYFLTGERVSNGPEHELKELEDYLENPSDFTVCVFFAPYDKLDKRKKVTKLLTKEAVTLDVQPMNERDMVQYVKSVCQEAGYAFKDQAFELLLDLTDRNLSRMMQELDKLMLYHQESKMIVKSSVEQLVSKSLEQNIFELNEFVLKKDVKRSIALYQDLLTQKEDPIKIIALMIGQFRLLLQVKILRKKGYQQGDIASLLKVHPYRVKLAMQKEQQFDQSLLSNAHHHLIDADYQIKSGKVNPEMQFELFVLKFAGEKEALVR